MGKSATRHPSPASLQPASALSPQSFVGAQSAEVKLRAKDTEEQSWGAAPPRISVVVPTYNRHTLLGRCLVALLHQDCDPTLYEVIVVDDANNPDTRQFLDSLWPDGIQPCCRYVAGTGAHGPAAARNLGWRAARGDIIAFTDDDCIPSPQWLRAGLNAFAADVSAVWGKLQMPLPANPTDYERDAAGLAHAPFVTANCFVRRSALAAVHGFDERFTAPWREDSDLYFSLLQHHAKILHVPAAEVVHPVRPAPWGVSLAQQRKSLFNALLYKKHPHLYRQYIQSAPPWRYYVIVSALLFSFAAGLGGSTAVAVAAVGVWLAFTIGFCVQRLRQTAHTLSHVMEMVVTSVLIPPLAVFWRLYGALKFRVWFL